MSFLICYSWLICIASWLDYQLMKIVAVFLRSKANQPNFSQQASCSHSNAAKDILENFGEGEITTRSNHLYDKRARLPPRSRYGATSTQQVVDFGSSKYFSAKTLDSETGLNRLRSVCRYASKCLSIHLGLLASSFWMPTFGWEWIERHFLCIMSIVGTISHQNNL